MSLAPLAGHEELRDRLARSARAGRLPASLLLHGPPGVGKQRLALWLGQLLLCEERSACGACRSCRLAERLEHPDLHWFFPLPRPTGASSREKLREKLETARMEELARRRESPLEPPEHEKATGIYLAAVDEMRARAVRRPAMGDAAVFVVGDAEAMVPQAASQQAANAFLKLLEEPPEDTWIVLTSSRRGALLPTVRSRVLSLRVAPLPRERVARFLVERASADPEEAEEAARRSRGSIGRALADLRGEGHEARDDAEAFVAAALSPRVRDRWRFAAGVGPSGARGEFHEMLESVVEVLRDLMALSLEQPDRGFDPGRATRAAGGELPRPEAIARAVDRVDRAREEARRNVNPQAVTATLLGELARDLDGRGRSV